MINLYPGTQNYYIYLVKLALKRAMFYNGEMSDIYDENLKRAVIDFKKSANLSENGDIDSSTWQLLEPYLYGYNTYRVEEGDSVYKISEKLNSAPELIYTANPDIEPYNLKVGEIIFVPYKFSLVPGDIPYSYALTQYIVFGLKARYPFIETSTAGTSVMGKQLYSVKIGQGGKEVFYNASHHANEWITTPVLLKFIEDYSNSYATGKTIYGKNAKELYDMATLYVIPLVNPDGVDLVTGAIMQDTDFYRNALEISKNYPDIPFPDGWKANIEGVDPNLSYPAMWERAKETKYSLGFTSPAPRDFVGNEPLAAPESRSVYDFTKKHNFRLTLSYHTQGSVIYWKFADYNPEGSYEIALEFQKASGYEVSETPTVSGYAGYKDWFIMEYNLPGYTIEAGQGENPLPLSQLNRIYNDNLGILILGITLSK